MARLLYLLASALESSCVCFTELNYLTELLTFVCSTPVNAVLICRDNSLLKCCVDASTWRTQAISCHGHERSHLWGSYAGLEAPVCCLHVLLNLNIRCRRLQAPKTRSTSKVCNPSGDGQDNSRRRGTQQQYQCQRHDQTMTPVLLCNVIKSIVTTVRIGRDCMCQ